MSDSDSEDVYEYTLVRFTHRGRRRAVEEIDIVNSDWLSYDGKRGKCTTKFAESITDQETFHKLVKTLAPAPASWPRFPVEIVGRARSYTEALRKLEQLRTEVNVLTEDTDNDISDIQKKMEAQIRQKQLQDELQQMKSSLSANSSGAQSSKSYNKGGKGGKAAKKPAASAKDKSLTENELTVEEILEQNEVAANGRLESRDSAGESAFDNHSQGHEQDMDIEDRAALNSEPPDDHAQNTNHNLEDAVEVVDTSMEEVHTITEIELESFTCKTDFEVNVIKMLASMGKQISDIESKQDSIEGAINSSKEEIFKMKLVLDDIVTFLMDKKVTKMTEINIDFTRKYNYTFPINSLEQFLQFDKELSTNKFLKNDVTLKLSELFNIELSLNRSLVIMLRFIISKGIALKFTACRSARKETGEKQLRFVLTNVYSLISGIIKFKRNKKSLATDCKALVKAISEVLCNVKQWPK